MTQNRGIFCTIPKTLLKYIHIVIKCRLNVWLDIDHLYDIQQLSMKGQFH